MRARNSNLFWGLLMILGGGLALAQSLGYLDDLGTLVWSAVFAGLSLLFLVGYLVSGWQKWGLLFPSSISAGVALTIYLAETTRAGAALGSPIFIGVALPFVLAFFLNPRKSWWALIPAWVMIVLTVITLVVDHVQGEVIGALFLFSIALPFYAVFFANRTQRWALIPAFVLTAVGMIPLMVEVLSGELIGAFVTLMIALPFFVIYFWSSKNWWALIPAGVMGTIAIALFLFLPGPGEIDQPGWMAAFMFLGWALTFGALWLRRSTLSTGWAAYPALGLGLAAVMAFFLGTRFELFWPLSIIAVGVAVLLGSLRKRPVG